jgi:hypothetical protein
VAEEYFKKIFTSNQPDNEVINKCLNGMGGMVTEAMNTELVADFTTEEVHKALKQMYPTKAPGPDGMSAIFYQSYWEIVGPEVTQAILSILHSGFMLRKINFTHIVLIPKIKEPVKITDYRPIALCNVIYKIVSKILANRLKKVLPHVISNTQSAFVPGRLITDNVLVAFEILHSMSIKNRGKRGQMALKLDMSKAYDRVEWGFVEAVMRRLGFAEEWIRLIMMCLSTVSYSILLNGVQSGNFTASRGIRQGDPLSPYIFLLCAEGLSSLLKEFERERKITGITASRGGPRLTHLFFANDSILFCQASSENCRALCEILQIYEEASGQQLNRSKTSLFFTKNTSATMKQYIKNLFHVLEIKSHEKYLGLPSFIGRSKKAAFNGIKDRVWQKINGWKEKLLSKAGREILIKAVAQSIPTYLMSCFKLPDSLCNELNSMASNFWWGHKATGRNVHWMKWEKLCVSKETGGLGFRDLKTFNLALLAKQGWRILQQPQSLVARVFKAKYFATSNFMDATLGNRPSYAWRSIFMAREVLHLGLRWHIGDGKSVDIWRDPWLPTKGSFMVRSDPQGSHPVESVSDLILADSQRWNVELIKEVFSEWEANVIVSIPLPPRQRVDHLFWDDTKNGLFSVKSAYYLHLRHRAAVWTSESSVVGRDKKFWKFLWALSIPPKVKSFLWRACVGILPTNTLMCRRHLRGDGNCPSCNHDCESVEHVLWSCPVANDVWAESKLKVLKWGRFDHSFCDLLNTARSRLGVEDLQLFCCVIYFIWLQRNHMVYDESCSNPIEVMQQAAKLATDYRESKVFPPQMRSGTIAPQQNMVWVPPTAETFKVNWELIAGPSPQAWWVGILICDAEGFVLAAMCAKLQFVHAVHPWADGAIYALNFALELGFFDIIFEGSSSLFLTKLVRKDWGNSIQDMWVKDVWAVLQKFRSSAVSSVHKECNRGALLLAQLGAKCDKPNVWLEDFPIDIQDAL